MISIAGSGILSDVSVLVLWPYNRLPQSSYVWDVWSLEVCVDLGQIAKLSPGTLVWCTELGLSDLLPTFVFWVYSYFFWAQGISGCSISVWRELCWCLPNFIAATSVSWVTQIFLPVLSAGWCLFVRVGPWFCLLLFLKGPTVWTGSVSFLPLCWAPVAGLHCLLPSTS